MSLTDEDLAYMRETQAEHRPTQATLDSFHADRGYPLLAM